MLESTDSALLYAQLVLPVALILSMPGWSYRLSQRTPCVQQSLDRLLLTKLAVTSSLFAMKLFSIYNRHVVDKSATAVDLVSVVEAFCLSWLVYVQHIHSPTPLAALSIYLSADIAVKLRAFWAHYYHGSSLEGYECLLLESLCLKLVLIVLHERSNWSNLKRRFKLDVGREATAGIWSRVFGLPLASSLLRAENWAMPKIEELDDTPISKELEHSFYEAWSQYGQQPHGLSRSCASAMAALLVIIHIAKIAFIAITTLVPFWVEFTLQFAEEYLQADRTDPKYVQLQASVVLGCFTVFLLWMVAQTAMTYFRDVIMLNLRGILTLASFKKLHSLSERSIANHARLSLISRNITSLETSTKTMFVFYLAFMECIVTAIFLWQDLGTIATLSLLVVPYIAHCIMKHFEPDVVTARATSTKKQEDRSSAVTAALSSIRSAKVTGNAAIQAGIVARLRVEEAEARVAHSKTTAVSHGLAILLHTGLPFFILAGNYYWQDGKFNAAVFVKNLLFLCRYMKSSMYAFKSTSHFGQWLACWTRIEDFLRLPDDIAEPAAAEVPRRNEEQGSTVVRAAAAFIAPETRHQACVKNANFVLERGTLTVLTGDVATGKSTLLLAMLGQSNVVDGTFLVNEDSISYCGQDSWVQNISIQDNIVGDAGFEQQWYDEVLDACLLRSDVARLPGESQYIVGTMGVKLDRGQRQRLALARSVYSRARLTLLDDVLSDQSAIAAQQLVVNLFSSEGLLTSGRTVFVTAKIWIPFARATCNFMTIDAAGAISRTTLDRLIDTIPPENTDRDFTEQLEEDSYVNNSSYTISSNELDNELRGWKASPAGSKRSPLRDLLAGSNWLTVAKGLTLLTGTLILEYAPMILFRPWLASQGQDNFPYWLAVLMTVLAAIGWGLAAKTLRVEVATVISNTFHDRLLQAVFGAPYSFFTAENVADSTDMLCETFRTFTVDAYELGMQLPYHILDAIFSFVLLSIPNPALVPLFSVMLVVAYLIFELQYKGLNPLVHSATHAEFALRSHFSETASGSAYIRAMNWRRRHTARTNFVISQSQKAQHHVKSYTRLVNIVVDFVNVFWVTLFLWICLRWKIAPYHIGLGFFALCQHLQLMEWTVQFWNVFNNNLSTVTKMNTFIESIPKEVHGPFKLPPANWPTAGRIEMREAYISYDVDGANPVLRNVKFNIPGNRETGFFGHAESGKTALLLAICRGTHYKGSITLDGVEIRDVGPDVLKRLITVVPEAPVLFFGTTIRQALLPYEIVNPPIGGPGILRAFDRVLYNVGLLDMVNRVGGLEAPMDRLKLSREQLLLFGLAQSLMMFFLDRSPIILIDSLLSRVSSKTFKMMRMMKNDIFKMFEGTVILTSDYPSVVWDSDRMGRIRNGTVSVMEKRALPQGSSRS